MNGRLQNGDSQDSEPLRTSCSPAASTEILPADFVLLVCQQDNLHLSGAAQATLKTHWNIKDVGSCQPIWLLFFLFNPT